MLGKPYLCRLTDHLAGPHCLRAARHATVSVTRQYVGSFTHPSIVSTGVWSHDSQPGTKAAVGLIIYTSFSEHILLLEVLVLVGIALVDHEIEHRYSPCADLQDDPPTPPFWSDHLSLRHKGQHGFTHKQMEFCK